MGDSILVDREVRYRCRQDYAAHDFNDFEAGLRHDLKRIKILDLHAHLRLADSLADPAVSEAVENLPWQKRLARRSNSSHRAGIPGKSEPHKMALGKCYRCKTVVEPFLSDQWFVKIAAGRTGDTGGRRRRVRIIPEAWKNNYLGWGTSKTGQVSRQIWWGQPDPRLVLRKPAWRDIPASQFGWSAAPFLLTRRDRGEDAAGRPSQGHRDALVQDPMSWTPGFVGLWPFSTFGWKANAELKAFIRPRPWTGLDILVLLGRAHDRDGLEIHGRGAVPRCLHPRTGPRCRRPKSSSKSKAT